MGVSGKPAYKKLAVVLLAGFVSCCAAAQSSCDVNQIQKLFGQNPRPTAAVKDQLAACQQGGNRDYRIALFEGVMARERGQLGESVILLTKSHDAAPQEIVPLLELAATEERMTRPQQARRLYQQVLQLDPNSRAAILGLARVARSQDRFSEAMSMYQRLREKDPNDPDALSGMAWIALANKRFTAARAGFSSTLRAKPSDPEAQAGLKQTVDAWRYQLDLNGGASHTNAGTAGMGNADLQVSLNARNTIEVGNTYNSSELPLVQFVEPTQLPTEDIHLGYFYRVPSNVNASLAYDFRDHAGSPNEHWLAGGVGDYFGKGFQWLAGARGAFGAPEWNNLLLLGGLVAPLGRGWQAGVTGYFDKADFGHSQQTLNGYPNSSAFSVDISRQGPGRLFLNIGGGYSPDISNADIHARAVLPLSRKVAFLGAVDHVSINNETQANLGLRLYWQ